MTTPLALGIDLGGTNVRLCLLEASGARLAERIEAVPRERPAAAILDQVVVWAGELRATHSPTCAGLAIAGALDANDRLVPGMANIPQLAGVALRETFAAALGLAVTIENDARAAMWGEARFGAARGVANALMLTLGTGIGGGLLLDGRVRAGPRRMAGEICLRQVPALDAPSRLVALEDIASPGGLRRTRGLDPEALARAAAAGDPEARAEMDRIATCLAHAIVDTHVTLDLERVVLAGGMVAMGPLLLDAVRAAYMRLAPPAVRDHLTIAATELGPWAGAMGAAALALDRL